jgi:predicted transcriptional regulator
VTLESRVLDILISKDASAEEIAEELDLTVEEVERVLRRLKAAGFLIEISPA